MPGAWPDISVQLAGLVPPEPPVKRKDDVEERFRGILALSLEDLIHKTHFCSLWLQFSEIIAHLVRLSNWKMSFIEGGWRSDPRKQANWVMGPHKPQYVVFVNLVRVSHDAIGSSRDRV